MTANDDYKHRRNFGTATKPNLIANKWQQALKSHITPLGFIMGYVGVIVMDLKVFKTSLSYDEKLELFNLLAIDIVKKPTLSGLTTVNEFIVKNKNDMSTRLKNVLFDNLINEYVELIDCRYIHRYRNASMNTQDEFIKLRGF